MAKTTKSRTVKKGSPKKGKAARVARKAPVRPKGPKGKPAQKAAAKGAPKGRRAQAKPVSAASKRKEVAESSAMPYHAVSVEAARRAVARPTKEHHEAQMERAEQMHEDPRGAGVPQIGPEGSKVQSFNYGQFKNKAVARLDKPQNWFRRAAKPKQ